MAKVVRLKENFDDYVRTRLMSDTKQNFYNTCDKNGIVPSDLMRQWILEYIETNKNK